ncbi:MAG: hypothetical protein QXD04_02980 [Candidatus Bathyarchaeia archaeon]
MSKTGSGLGDRLRRILARARYGASERLVEEWSSALEELLQAVERLPETSEEGSG